MVHAQIAWKPLVFFGLFFYFLLIFTTICNVDQTTGSTDKKDKPDQPDIGAIEQYFPFAPFFMIK